MNKKIIASIVALFFLIIPATSSASTTAELQAQIQALLDQVAALQSQLSAPDQSGPSATSPLPDGSTPVVDGTAPLQVLAPNGGERWEIGTMNTITWAPYGYDPDINPSQDVVAYLEKKQGRSFRVVGTVVPTGKASIHWESDINDYGQYPNAGEYYIRIKNTKTGESDRSDRPFTFTPRAVDLKVNRSDGPVRLTDGQKVTVSWTTRDTFSSCLLTGVRASLDEDSYNILDIPTQGGSMTAYFRAQEGGNAIGIYCEKSSDGGGRWDNVAVKTSGTSRPFVTVLSPNGGEQLNPSEQLAIKFNSLGLESASIALYKNDQWKYWIEKNVSPSAKDLSDVLYAWTPSQYLVGLGEGDNAGAIFKIYVTGQRADGTGYVDDKSDKAFSFVNGISPGVPTPGSSADLKVNGSDGPLTLELNQKVKLSWKTKGMRSCSLGNVSTSLNGWDHPTIGNIPLSGEMEAYYTGYNPVIWLSCFKLTDQDTSTGKDGVYLTSAPTPPTTEGDAIYGTVNRETFSTSTPTITGTATGLKYIVLGITTMGGDKVYAREGIPVVKGKWSHTVSEPIANGSYLAYVYSSANNKTGELLNALGRAPITIEARSVRDTVPTCTLSANKTSVTAGESVTLTWTSKYADYVSLNGDKQLANDSWTLTPTVTKTYSLVVSGSGGKTACSQTITVTDAPVTPNTTNPVLATPVVMLWASPTTVRAGAAVTLSWSTANTQRCVLSGGNIGEYGVEKSGTYKVRPLETSTYRLWCANDPGTGKDGPSGEQSVTVWVTEQPTRVQIEASVLTAVQQIARVLEQLKAQLGQ